MDETKIIFQAWIEEYTQPLLTRAIYLVSSKVDAEDLVQEVYMAAFENFSSFKGESKPLTWLMQILKNKVGDYYRNKYKTTTSISLNSFFDETGFWRDNSILRDWSTENKNIWDDENFNDVWTGCLERLPPKWQIPIKLYYLENKKANNVCQETGITTTNLWKILQRSRLQIRECLEVHWFGENY